MYEIVYGIDIGFKNMGISCIKWYDKNHWEVKLLKNYDTGINKKDSTITISKKIKIFLDNFVRINGYGFDDKTIVKTIIVERQPNKRRIMNKITMSIINYFTFIYSKETNVILMNSMAKFKCNHDFKTHTYNDRKKASVSLGCTFLLDETNSISNTKFYNYVININKKDDMFDALLLILKYLNYY